MTQGAEKKTKRKKDKKDIKKSSFKSSESRDENLATKKKL